MTATAAQIAQTRRMVSEPDATTYSDAAIQGYIQNYPTLDERGLDPYWWNTGTNPPTQVATIGYIPTYDLHAAAADIWQEKAALIAANFDFSSEGQSFTRSQTYEQAMQMVRFHNSQRAARTMIQRMKPERYLPSEVIGNLPEQDESWTGQ